MKSAGGHWEESLFRRVMGGKDEEMINQVFTAALDYGINFVDTSRVYMDSETNIGEVMKTQKKGMHYRHKISQP